MHVNLKVNLDLQRAEQRKIAVFKVKSINIQQFELNNQLSEQKQKKKFFTKFQNMFKNKITKITSGE